MNEKTYKLRLLRFIKNEKTVARGKITRDVLGRRIYKSMAELNVGLTSLERRGLIKSEVRATPGSKGGPPPTLFWVTQIGEKWLKDNEK